MCPCAVVTVTGCGCCGCDGRKFGGMRCVHELSKTTSSMTHSSAELPCCDFNACRRFRCGFVGWMDGCIYGIFNAGSVKCGMWMCGGVDVWLDEI